MLAPALDDPVPAIRVLAVVTLASRGVVEALPVLIEGLTIEQGLPYSDPPQPLSDIAGQTLAFYTGQSFPTPEAWQR